MAEEKVTVKGKTGLPLKHILSPEIPVTYSDNFAIKAQDGMFVMYFFQNAPPLAFTQSELDAVVAIETYCVAKILLTPPQLKKNIDAMNQNFEKFLKATGLTAESFNEPEIDKVEVKP